MVSAVTPPDAAGAGSVGSACGGLSCCSPASLLSLCFLAATAAPPSAAARRLRWRRSRLMVVLSFDSITLEHDTGRSRDIGLRSISRNVLRSMQSGTSASCEREAITPAPHGTPLWIAGGTPACIAGRYVFARAPRRSRLTPPPPRATDAPASASPQRPRTSSGRISEPSLWSIDEATECLFQAGFGSISGGGGIRTLDGRENAHNGFRDRRIQPLCHPSGGRISRLDDRLAAAAAGGLAPRP